jgi:BNR repeat-like domain
MKRKNATAFILLMSLAGTSCQRMKTAHISMESTARSISADASSGSPRLGLWVPNTVFALTVAADDSQSRLQLQFSPDGGDTFGKPIILSAPNANVRGEGENSPALATDVQADVYAAWFQSVAGATQLMVKPIDRSGGKAVNVLDADRKPDAYAGFPTVATTHAGDVYVAWLDERDKANPADSSSVYFSRSSDHGATFSRNIRIAASACGCCRPQIYVGPAGDIYLAWRQVFEGSVRDMVLARSTDGGKTFSQPLRVAVDNWVLHACPDVGPAIGVSHGRLYVAWYSEGQDKPGIRLAISDNGGSSFAPSQFVSADIRDATHPRLSVSEDGRVLLTFQGRLAQQDTKWRSNQAFVVEIKGANFTPPMQVTNSEHSVHDPDVLAGSSGRLFLAWTESINDRNQTLLSRGWLR